MFRLRSFLVGSSLMLAASCSPASSEYPAPISVATRAELCDTISNTGRCARAVESHQLDRTSAVRRTDRGLCFDGFEPCVRPDSSSNVASPHFYYLGTLDRPPFHVLWVQHYEGNSILLVHRSAGTRVWVDAMPVPAPSGDLVAVASADLLARYNPNRLTILEAVGDSLVERWSIEPEEWGPASAWWTSESRLRVETIVLDTVRFETVIDDTVTVERSGDRWRLDR